jgi:hypothetical protein
MGAAEARRWLTSIRDMPEKQASRLCRSGRQVDARKKQRAENRNN